MRIDQRIAYKDSIFVVLKHNLSLQNNSAYTVNNCWNLITNKLTDILMPIGAIGITMVFVETKVKFCSMLHDCDIQRRQ